jgi:hypothetical protein
MFKAAAFLGTIAILLLMVSRLSLGQTPPLHPAPVAVPTSKAQSCIGQSDPVPNWTGKAHPNCSVDWSKLGSMRGRTLYRARYQWPSDELLPDFPDTQYRVVVEVLFEGTGNAKEVTPLLAVQRDETYSFLRPLTIHYVGDLRIVEIRECLNGTGGCGQEFLVWRSGKVLEIPNSIRKQVEQRLPTGYHTAKSPEIDIDTLTGRGGVWLDSDPNCCPSASVTFTFSVSDRELMIRDFKFEKGQTEHR